MKKILPGTVLVLLFTTWTLDCVAAEKPTLLKAINLTSNTSADEDNAHVSSDGRTLYFSAKLKGKWEIMVSQRRSTRYAWPRAKTLGGYIQTRGDDGRVSTTAERRYPQYMYYATTKDEEAGNFDIYVAVNQGLTRNSVFSSPSSVGPEVNTKEDEKAPWLTGDGRVLFFSRKTNEGWRVFLVSRRSSRGARGFGEAQLMKVLPPDYHHVTLGPRNRVLYMQGPLEKGRTGLFRATRTREGWSKPEPLTALNHPEAPTGDRSPCLSRDGRLLYFTSDRPGGKGGTDLWVIRTALLKDK